MIPIALRNEEDNMTTPLRKASPDTGQKDSANSRRKPRSHDIREVHDGRKRQKLSHSPEKGIFDPTTTIADDAPRILKGQDSTSSDQSASRWFREVNDNFRPAQSQPTELDDDPPFYMTNHANYVPTNFVASGADHRFGGMPQSRIDSENEDLRGVIDDLTIENKRLKHMMRSRPRHHRNVPDEVSQQQDRLFEVRMHGLPPGKRRELEHLLKDFATSVHSKAPTRPTASFVKTTSKSSSNSLNFMNSKPPQTDSGYASNSNSAPVSGGRIPLSDASPVPIPIPQKSSTNKAVKNYLQDIPNTLLPKQNPIMSERARSTLVVRRLEQLFTGRKAAPGDHDQPKQQQEISQSAARADRLQDSANSKKRKAEGPREAHIMPPDSKVNLDAINHFDLTEGTLSPRFRKQENNTGSRIGSPDQRPTRPLDLDVHRAQVATDNIQYLRHLGMPFFEPSEYSQDNDENWMYLNLLAGLAQLHTLNVTPEFIRRAVKKLSRKFELSKDGHKVRWIGGVDETKFTVEDEKVIEGASMSPHASSEDTGTGRNSNKRSQSNSTSNQVDTSAAPSDSKTSGLQTSSDSKQQQPTTSGISNVQSSNVTKPTVTSSAFDYKPIVYRGKQFAEYQESYLRDSDESFDSQSGDSSGLANAMSKSNLSTKDREEGHLTFYNNPFFFSDLSADREPSNMKRSRPVVIGEILGIPLPDFGCESPLRFSDATYFTTKFAAKPFQVQTAEDQKKLYFKLPELDPITEAGEYETMPVEFEVSGLGGVTPSDNFALDVKTEIQAVHGNNEPTLIRRLPFSGRKYHAKYLSQIKTCDKIELLPSKLPPPSYVFFTSSSSSDAVAMDDDDEDLEDSDESSDTSSPFVDEEFPAPPAFLQQFASYSSDNAIDDNENEMESSDIDMLAIARRVNPQQIAEQERVYAINQPGGPGVAAVAGSLAATVGASGSGSSALEEVHMVDISSNGSAHGSDEDDEIENA